MHTTMGRSQEEEASRPVKRQVVSVSANLEVVSEESFALRLQGMGCCLNCQKERVYNHGQGRGPRHHHHNNNSSNNNNNNNVRQGRRGKQGRRKQVKANTPIVIHLKDTLRSALQQRQRSLDTDSDVSVRSTDDDVPQDTFGDVSSIPEFVPQYMHQATVPYHHHHHHHPHHPHHHHHHHQALSFTPPTSAVSQRREKSQKNLTALISVIEKAHHKDSRHMESNLVGQAATRSKFSHLLNNAVSLAEKGQHRSIVECDNVDVICNDLHKSDKVAETVDDTDSVSDKSSVVSSSDVFSDSDSQVVEDTAGFEFTAEELQRLAEYTTGYPIYRYDCAPSDCPECLSTWYYHQYYQYEGCTMDTAFPQRTVRSHRGRERSGSHNDSEQDMALEASDNDGEAALGESAERLSHYGSRRSHRRRTLSSSSSCGYGQQKSSPPSPTVRAEAVWPWERSSRQLWDIDISQTGRRTTHDMRTNPYPNSVFLDLTGTDVTISVYYHHSLLQDEAARSAVAALMVSPTTATTSTTASSSASLYSIYYSSYVGTPTCGLSLPLAFFNDDALPKIAMVPPHELKKYNVTMPPEREWITVSEGLDPAQSTSVGRFTVMCYNVLCDKYCTRQQYGYCPSWALDWEYRKKAILEHIFHYSADIITLQEVETAQHYGFFSKHLEEAGYEGIFSPKSRARTMSEHESRRVDGCAIFFKKEKFSLLQMKLVEFNQLALANADGNQDMLNRVMPKDNIGLCALLETKATSTDDDLASGTLQTEMLVVTTAHIHWDPEFSDVKMVQTMMWMWELQKFVEESAQKYSMPFPEPYTCNSIPIILCGDLNSLPDSGVIEFLTQGKVATNHEDFKDTVYDQAMSKMCNRDQTHIYHNLHLSPAYSDIMPVTNYTYDFKGIIDYIFHSKNTLKVLKLLGPYNEKWFRQNKVLGCPHPHIPSDHFSLLVEFEMTFHTVESDHNHTDRDLTTS